jgi:hypothetical protein
MKQIKFITTFSKNGYHVYGKTWIDSFLARTAGNPDIIAEIYVNGMEISTPIYKDKIFFFDYDTAIPERTHWQSIFLENTIHDQWNRDLALKFSYKSFVMIHALRKTSTGYVIWLDADCIFLSEDFSTWCDTLLEDTLLACQRESGSEHVESGIIIFNSEHISKTKFVDKLESLYMTPAEFNNFSQFFDGFAIGRTLNTTHVPYIDLNKNYGHSGIQSDPNCTFLHPEIKNRFKHNIGITGKRQYADWNKYKHDPFFQLIHGANELSPEETKEQNLKRANTKLKNITKVRRNKSTTL